MRVVDIFKFSLLGCFIVLNPACVVFEESASTTTKKPSTGSNYSGNSVYKKKPTPKKTVIHNVRTTAYCHLENEPGAVGNLNAIGTQLRMGPIQSAAADWSRYPLGTQFRIVGQSQLYEIDDYGSALVGNGTIDFYKPTLGAMNAWGLRYVDIEVVKWGCYHRSLSYLPANAKYWHVRKMHYDIKAKIAKWSASSSSTSSSDNNKKTPSVTTSFKARQPSNSRVSTNPLSVLFSKPDS